MITIPDIIQQQVAVRPDQAALIESPNGVHRQLTYRELDVLSSAFAKRLHQNGVRPAETVLVFVPMSISLYVCLLGIFRLGVTAVFLDPSAGLKHINDCCQIQLPRAFLGTWKAHLLRLASPALRRIPLHFWISSDSKRLAGVGSLSATILAPEPDTPALITFTSGSTGKPKAAVRTHGFLIAQHHALSEAIALQPGERDLTTLPIFVLANLASGVTSILPDADMSRPGFIDSHRVARQIERYHPTRSGGSPAFYERLLTVSQNEKSPLLPFQKIYTGGAPVFPSLLEKIQEAAPQANVVAVYGSTEAEPISHIDWKQISSDDLKAMRSGKGLLVGQPVPQIEVAILHDQWGQSLGLLTASEFENKRVPLVQSGEICVTGEHVLKGYLNGQGDSETKFKVDDKTWHRTGDAGYLDDSGRLWLLGRCTARVEDSRGTLYPFTVECVAQTYPFVRRSAFLGKDNQRFLAIEYSRDLSKAEHDEILHALDWAYIDRLIPLKKIPVDKRHNAKVDYPALWSLISP